MRHTATVAYHCLAQCCSNMLHAKLDVCCTCTPACAHLHVAKHANCADAWSLLVRPMSFAKFSLLTPLSDCCLHIRYWQVCGMHWHSSHNVTSSTQSNREFVSCNAQYRAPYRRLAKRFRWCQDCFSITTQTQSVSEHSWLHKWQYIRTNSCKNYLSRHYMHCTVASDSIIN